MISLIIPPKDQISRVSKMLADEYGTASNIKSRVNRLSVLGAITSVQQRLKLYSKGTKLNETWLLMDLLVFSSKCKPCFQFFLSWMMNHWTTLACPHAGNDTPQNDLNFIWTGLWNSWIHRCCRHFIFRFSMTYLRLILFQCLQTDSWFTAARS